MNKLTTLAAVYGILAIIGGVIGFLVAGSMVSLWTGIASGVAMVISALGILGRFRWGFQLGSGVSLLLALFFTFRFFTTRAWFPAGIMMALSYIVCIVLYWYLRSKFKNGDDLIPPSEVEKTHTFR